MQKHVSTKDIKDVATACAKRKENMSILSFGTNWSLRRNSPGTLDSILVIRTSQHPQYSIFSISVIHDKTHLSTGVTQSSVTTLKLKMRHWEPKSTMTFQPERGSCNETEVKHRNAAFTSLELLDSISPYWKNDPPTPSITNSKAWRFMVNLGINLSPGTAHKLWPLQNVCTGMQARTYSLPIVVFKTDSTLKKKLTAKIPALQTIKKTSLNYFE